MVIVTAAEARRLDERIAGHALTMDGGLVHGVSSLSEGRRYGLFALHELPEDGPDHGFPHVLAEVAEVP